MLATKEKSESKKKEMPTFTKQQILSSSKYKHRKDLINTLLEDDKVYVLEEVDERIEKFMKGKVK